MTRLGAYFEKVDSVENSEVLLQNICMGKFIHRNLILVSEFQCIPSTHSLAIAGDRIVKTQKPHFDY